ncbi:MAG: hypothetical protein EBU08_18535 [Micrococcales bacterium]|nr:hypothetical protein [Micrococcales bacterium]
MTQKTYRTAQGKIVDLGAMMVQNENVRAVGNMKANARGDIIDNHGHVVATRGQQVNRNLNRQTNANAGPIPTSNRNPTPEPKLTEAEQLEQDRQQRQAKREAMERGEKVELKGDAPTQGLAAAMARAEKLKDQE